MSMLFYNYYQLKNRAQFILNFNIKKSLSKILITIILSKV